MTSIMSHHHLDQANADQQDRPFHCIFPSCKGRFHRKFTLHEHLKTHTGEQPHQCPIASCGKRFSTSGNLARHRRLHSLHKLVCPAPDCTRSFTSQEKLVKHLKVHTGKVTHTCKINGCSRTFSTAGNLTRHMKTHHRMSQHSMSTPPSKIPTASSPLDVSSIKSEWMLPSVMRSDFVLPSMPKPSISKPEIHLPSMPKTEWYHSRPSVDEHQQYAPNMSITDHDISQLLDCLLYQDVYTIERSSMTAAVL